MTVYIPELLSLHARRTPDAPAVAFDNIVYSYGALFDAACHIAASIHAVSDNDGALPPIAVCMPKSALAVAALYGVLLSGRSYVPLDPALPWERMQQVLSAANVRCMIADRNDAFFSQNVSGLSHHSILIDASIFEQPHKKHLLSEVREDHHAAILFTSGSTGVPKGAVITHGNLGSFIDWAADAFALSANDRLASHAPLQFDLSFFDLFAALRVGACVSLVPHEIAGNGQLLLRFMNEQRITVWQSVPSALGLLVDAAALQSEPAAPTLRAVLFAGERMPAARLDKSLKLFAGARHYNIYGCTESNDTFMYEVPATPAAIPDPLPIGKALPYVDIKILDDEGNDVSECCAGVLWVATPTLMAGYLDSDATDQVIRQLSGMDGVSRRYYCTRDLVRRNADGMFEFLGRNDSITKTSGFRVNLQEVEDKLADHEQIDEVGLIAVPDDHLGSKLLAIVKPVKGRAINALQLKLFCGECLPKYMIPHIFHFTLDPLPKSRNGKIDKKALQKSYATAKFTL